MFKLIKPYKEQYPLFTINKIRSILSEVGIFVTERFIKDGDFFTCRLELDSHMKCMFSFNAASIFRDEYILFR